MMQYCNICFVLVFKVMEYSHPRNFLEDHFYLNMLENLLTPQLLVTKSEEKKRTHVNEHLMF